MIRCARCVLPDTYPGITFDAEGVCRHCRNYRPATTLGKEALDQVIAKYAGRGGPYDAVVMFSGGRDSTYVLHYLVTRLKLKVLAYTADNGFLPEQTHENIRNAVRILGVDHVMHSHPHLRNNLQGLLSAWLRRPSPAMIGTLCLGCRYALKRSFTEIARLHHVPLVVTGDGEPESSFASAFFTDTSSHTLRVLSIALGIGQEMMKNPRYLLSPSLPFHMVREAYQYLILPRFRRSLCRDVHVVGLFQYLPWDEQEIMSVVQDEMGWRQWEQVGSAWRSDCKVAAIKNYLYNCTLGFTKNDELISNLLRQGVLASREEGLTRLRRENAFDEGHIHSLCREIGLSESDQQRMLSLHANSPQPKKAAV